MSWQPNNDDLSLLTLALNEDLGTPWRDATTTLLFSDKTGRYTAQILSKHKEPLVICGVAWQ